MAFENPLVGTWTLVSWYNETAEGEKIYPFGDKPSGYISYSQDGFVFVHMAKPDRAIFVAPDDPFGGTAAEDSEAFKSHITYAGPYNYQNDRVIHSVTHSFCPNWVGTQQVRDVAFVGDILRLSAKGLTIGGRLVDAYLDWRRADPTTKPSQN